jgi:flagellar hook capping protein FlgD
MKRNLQSLLACVLCGAAMGIAPVAAQEQTAGAPGEWLARYASARSLGLGSAYVAMADDPLGVLWNPAGLSYMNQNQLRFENARLFGESQLNSLGFAVPGSRWPSLGIAMVSLGSGDFQQTNDMNDDLGTFKEGETAWLLTASKAFTPKIAVGANFKLVQQTVESFKAGGFGVDLGALYQVTPGIRLGASMMNLGGPKLQLRDVEEAYETHFRGGGAFSLLQGRGLVSLELDHTPALGSRVRAGAEYWIMSGIALRMGYSPDGGSGGFSYRFAPQYTLDYATADHALGLQHRVGVSMNFGGFFASSNAEPAVFSPTGEHAVTRISLNSRTKASPVSWTLDIVNKADEVVRRFGGAGQPPSHLEWDGKDENGLPLPDGTYRYSLVVKDTVGRAVAGPVRMVAISTGGPQGNVPLVPAAENPEK